MTENEITWTDIEKLFEESERKKKEAEEKFEKKRAKIRRKKPRMVQLPKVGVVEIPYTWTKLPKKEAAEKYIEKYGEPFAEDKVTGFYSGLSSDIHNFRWKTEAVKTREEKMKVLDDLMSSLKQRVGRFEHEVKGIERPYKPGLVDRILNYVKAKRKAKVYLFLSALFLIYLIFRNKSSIIGYTVVETVTSNYLSYFLVFILVVCLIAFYLDKK